MTTAMHLTSDRGLITSAFPRKRPMTAGLRATRSLPSAYPPGAAPNPAAPPECSSTSIAHPDTTRDHWAQVECGRSRTGSLW